MRLLIVEDDVKIASFVTTGLRQAGYAVDHVSDGKEGLHLVSTVTYDVAILDVMLPGIDGLSLLDQMRSKKVTTPVLILSAKRSVDDRVEGLQRGGDDYLTKPFAFSELLARVQALLRRTATAAEGSRLTMADVSADLLTREVKRNGEKIDLQPREFALLEYLMRNPGRVVSKTMILEHIWDYSFDPQTNVVDVLVCRLRNKIDRNFQNKIIHTVRGIGYVLKNS